MHPVCVCAPGIACVAPLIQSDPKMAFQNPFAKKTLWQRTTTRIRGGDCWNYCNIHNLMHCQYINVALGILIAAMVLVLLGAACKKTGCTEPMHAFHKVKQLVGLEARGSLSDDEGPHGRRGKKKNI